MTELQLAQQKARALDRLIDILEHHTVRTPTPRLIPIGDPQSLAQSVDGESQLFEYLYEYEYSWTLSVWG